MAPVSVSEAVNGETSIWLRIELLIFLVAGLDSAVFMYLQPDRMLWEKRLAFDRLFFYNVLYNMHSTGAIVSVSLTLWLLFQINLFFHKCEEVLLVMEADCRGTLLRNIIQILVYWFLGPGFFFLCAIKAVNILFSKQIYPVCSF